MDSTAKWRGWRWLGLALASALAGCAAGGHVAAVSDTQGGPAPIQITEQVLAAEKQARERLASDDLSRLVAHRPAPYRIGPGDVVAVVVWDHPELAAAPSAPTEGPAGFVVDHDGNVHFPLVGAVPLGGLSEQAARALLASRLARYLKRPDLTLRVEAYRSQRVYVDGEVKTPGLQAINDIPMSLNEAISRAGGLLPTADQSRIVLERAGTRYRIDLPDLLRQGINPAELMLDNGDLLRVPSREASKVFVSGEVITPKVLTMHDGHLSLNEALGEAGGINPNSADARQVYVVRQSAQGPRVYQLDARAAGALAMAEGFDLSPKDVVYVAATSLANWHRSISLLFPGALSSAVGAVKP